MSLFESASLVVTPNGTKASKLYAIKPTSGAGDLTVVRATTATRVNSTGLIESVANNVPRLDYLNSTCPSILVEPQRTNLALRSQEIDNASWSKSSGTITANATTSPDGSNNAEQWAGDGTNAPHDFYQGFTGGSTTTSSIYVKKNTAQFVYISLNYQGTATDWGTGVYDLDNLTTSTFQNGGVTSPIATITNVGNGWRRITLSVTTANTSLFCMYGISNSLTPSFNYDRGRTAIVSSASFYAWGAQLEVGSYPTSYIPTVASAVTRNADVISKTGISSLIGTEFTLFFDGYETTGGDFTRYLILKGSGSTYENLIILETSSSNRISVTIKNAAGNVFFAVSNSLTNGQRVKIGIRCKNNDFAFYINGLQLGSQLSGTVPTTSDLYLGYYTDYADNFNKINTAAIWKTGLTNAELAELTTI